MYKNVTIYRHDSELVNSPAAVVKDTVNTTISFISGLKKHGIKYEEKNLKDSFEKTDLAIFWGTDKRVTPRGRRIKELQDFLREHGTNWISLERGFVKRSNHFMAGFNGLNGNADFKNKDMPSDRWEKLDIELKEWRTGGEKILFCGQVPWDASCNCVPNYEEWSDRMSEQIWNMTDREIVFRPHPDLFTNSPMLMFCPEERETDINFLKMNGVPIPSRISTVSNMRSTTFEEDIKDAWITISLNSNSGVDSIINGVPTIAIDKGSMAFEMSSELENIESPKKPDRTQWAHNLAYSQWTVDEMSEGLTWAHLTARS
jgi:hypothetical protein